MVDSYYWSPVKMLGQFFCVPAGLVSVGLRL